MLAACSKKPAAMPSDCDFLGLNETKQLGVKLGRRVYIADKNRNRANSSDLERTAEQDAADVMGGSSRLGRSVSRLEIDALRDCLLDLVVLRHLRQLGSFPKASIVHRVGAAFALPADLFDSIVKLVLMA